MIIIKWVECRLTALGILYKNAHTMRYRVEVTQQHLSKYYIISYIKMYMQFAIVCEFLMTAPIP